MDEAATRSNLIRRACIGAIPECWKVVSVSDVVDRKPNAIVGGPFGSDLVSSDYVPSGIPVIRGANMSDPIVSGDFVFISETKGKGLSANMAGAGDIVFTQRGTLGQVAIVPDSHFEKYLISQSQMKLSVNGDVVHKPYLLHYFASFAGQKQILDSAIQTGVPHTNLGILRNYAFPLPPMAEQEAIAEALSDADALIEGLERLIAKKRLIKQGAMQDLLTAKRRLPGCSGDWAERKLGEIATFGKGKGLPKSDVLSSGDILCVHYGSLFREQPVVIENLDTFTNSFANATLSQSGDVLMPTSDVTPSGLAVASCVQLDGVLLGGDILVIRPQREFLDGRFLASCIRQSPRQIMELVSGTTVFHIYGRDMGRFLIKFPPLSEQQRIVEVLSDMEAEIRTLETRLGKVRQVKEGMMQNLLTGRIRLV